MRAAELHLISTGQMTAARQDALAHARLECARILYWLDRPASLAVVEECRRQHPQFKLPPAVSFPRAYRMAYRWLGFQGAEVIAAAARRLRKLRARQA